MKRRNAEPGKLRRPIKRTKITEGMYGNSMLYLKFVMVWATVVLADYMLEFRFEFLWPFWMMLRSIYDSFKYQGLAFSVFFICIALTSDMICFFFIPLQYIFFAASTYVWVQYVWYSFADKGICLPTVAICCVLVYVEGALRAERGGVPGGGGFELCRPLAAHCVGYPAVTLGFGFKSYVGHRLRLRRQRQVRAENEFYFKLMRDAIPESALEQNQQLQTSKESKECLRSPHCNGGTVSSALTEASAEAHPNGSLRRRCRPDQNGVCGEIVAHLDKLEKHISQHNSSRDKSHAHSPAAHTNSVSSHAHALSNGSASGAGCSITGNDEDERQDHYRGSAKSSRSEKKENSTVKEEKRKNKKDKDRESNDSHKSTEQTKEHIVKEVESTNVKSNKDISNNKEKDKERDKEREREAREREKEREREREQREARECLEELKRVRAELAAARSGEAEARRSLAAAAAAERQRRADHNHLKQAHATLQSKVSAWRSSERAVLERRLGEERRARTAAEHQLLRARRPPSGECENEWCRNRRSSLEVETTTLRRELQRAHELAAQLQRDLTQATEQVRSLEARQEENGSPNARLASAWQALQERAGHLERSLSAETRVKLDLLSAFGDAKRQIHIQEGLISKQEKEIEELKAQMLAVMPTEFVTPVSSTVSKLRLSDGSPLDPNASVYTPKQLCSDA